MVGGDVLPAEVVSKWARPGRWLANLYGPTEATVACTSCRCDPGTVWRSSPPIGRPWPDRQMYLVDRWGNLTPNGIPGELLIGGTEGLARGYLNRPDLTAEKFVEDPFCPGMRVYRTRDLVRWTRDWQLEFLGRLDAQVQLNGMRVELEEIEHYPSRLPPICPATKASCRSAPRPRAGSPPSSPQCSVSSGSALTPISLR
jgi:non-ribosomal peptide synthetase component F